MYHPPHHKKKWHHGSGAALTLADALLRTEYEKEQAKWYQEYLANKQRYQKEQK